MNDFLLSPDRVLNPVRAGKTSRPYQMIKKSIPIILALFISGLIYFISYKLSGLFFKTNKLILSFIVFTGIFFYISAFYAYLYETCF